jgi:hypothetical protein
MNVRFTYLSSLTTLRSTTVDEVSSSIRRLPDKSSPTDHSPNSVLEDAADLVEQFVSHLFDAFMGAGRLMSCFERSFIMPIVKKAVLDKEDVQSYRLVSELSVLPTLTERLIARRLTTSVMQTGYRRSSHVSDRFLSCAPLILLHLSALRINNHTSTPMIRSTLQLSRIEVGFSKSCSGFLEKHTEKSWPGDTQTLADRVTRCVDLVAS